MFSSLTEGVLFGLTVSPWIMFWDIAFFENLFYVWPEVDAMVEDYEEATFDWQHCNYMGWWYKTGRIYLDVGINNRECKVGVHSYLVKNVEADCYGAAYTLSKVKYWKISPFDKYKNGMYEWGMNSCQDEWRFDQRDAVERNFWDSLTGDFDEM
jgi:hypothetical protein